MCFVFILTENKRYIYFLKKKLNITLEWFAEGSNAINSWEEKKTNEKKQQKKKPNEQVLTDSLKKKKPNKQTPRALISDVHYPFLRPRARALTMHGKANSRMRCAKEQFSKSVKGILSDISSLLAHVDFKLSFFFLFFFPSCNLLISLWHIRTHLLTLAYLCRWRCHREHTWVWVFLSVAYWLRLILFLHDLTLVAVPTVYAGF